MTTFNILVTHPRIKPKRYRFDLDKPVAHKPTIFEVIAGVGGFAEWTNQQLGEAESAILRQIWPILSDSGSRRRAAAYYQECYRRGLLPDLDVQYNFESEDRA